MTKSLLLSLTLVIGCSLIGCGPTGTANNAASNTETKPAHTDANNDALNVGANNEPGHTDTHSTEEPGIDLSKLPADLKGDAFDYYGLGRSEIVNLSVDDGTGPKPGTQSTKLTKVEKDYAEFMVVNEGALSVLGSVKIRLDKDGVKIISVNGIAAAPDTVELPNGLTKGKKWPFKYNAPDSPITGTNVLVGTQSVKTSVGTYNDALLIESTASGKQSGQQIQLKSKQWLVKGRGMVKTEFSRNVAGNKTPQIFKMEETK